MTVLKHVSALLGLAAISSHLSAHHATAADFDVKTLVVLNGAVQKMEWINPHAWLYLEVISPDGQRANWRIEGASMNAYAGRDFPKDLLKTGAKITITAYPAKDGSNTADGGTITFADGKRAFFGGSAPVDGLDTAGRPCILRRGTDCR